MSIPIAIADDHAMMRQGLTLLLQPHFDVVVQASNGRELLERLHHTPCQVVLLDLRMPEMDGLSTLPLLARDFPQLRVLIITMNVGNNHIAQSLEAGACGFVPKDATAEELVKAVQAVATEGQYINKAYLSWIAATRTGSPAVSAQLSPTDRQILQLICEQKTSEEMGELLHLSEGTINNHRQRIMKLTGCRNVAGLVLYAIREGYYQW